MYFTNVSCCTLKCFPIIFKIIKIVNLAASGISPFASRSTMLRLEANTIEENKLLIISLLHRNASKNASLKLIKNSPLYVCFQNNGNTIFT